MSLPVHATMILAPGRLLRAPEQIGASNMVVVADLGTAHATEKFLCPIGAGTVEAVSLFVIDPLHFKAGM
jgi:hypothetical protein